MTVPPTSFIPNGHGPSPSHLAYPTVQPDWADVIKDVRNATVMEEVFWLSCYRRDLGEGGSVHGSVRTLPSSVTSGQEEQGLPSVTGESGIEARLTDMHTMRISCSELGIEDTIIHSPSRCYRAFDGEANLLSFDVSPGEELIALGGTGGHISVMYVTDGSNRLELTQDIATDVNLCRFFPSGQVILTGGADMRLRVWSALDGSCPVTLTGHTGRIMDAAMVDRGRTIYSASRDGSVRLWELSSSRSLQHWSFEDEGPVVALSLCNSRYGEEEGEGAPTSPIQNLLAAGTQHGMVHCMDTRTYDQIFHLETGDSAPLTTLALEEGGYRCVVASDSGVLSTYDLRSPSTPIMQVIRNGSRITSVSWSRISQSSPLGIQCSTYDGATFLIPMNPSPSALEEGDEEVQTPRITEEWSGSELEAVLGFKEFPSTSHLWTASRDNMIRIYGEGV